MKAVESLAQKVGITRACKTLMFPRASFYRLREAPSRNRRRPTPPRALSPSERQTVLQQLNSPRFADQSPREAWATLLDEGTHLCSVRTMYRILKSENSVRERRNQLRHPKYKKPQLLATGPNQVWSWDLTKLHGPEKWNYYHLYVILDIYSRYVVGWMLASRESGELASTLLRTTTERQKIDPNQLTIHADNGSAPKSKCVAHMLADLGVTKSHSRPHTSNDNPYSEAQFKTMKYSHTFPTRFGCYEDARAFLQRFFSWYNNEHHHVGLGLLTPTCVHHGNADTVIADRQRTLDAAYRAHPDRFVRQRPTPPKLPLKAWINPPPAPQEDQSPTLVLH